MEPGYRPDCGLVSPVGHGRLVVHTDVQSMLLTGRRKGAQTVGVVPEWSRHLCIIYWRPNGRSQ